VSHGREKHRHDTSFRRIEVMDRAVGSDAKNSAAPASVGDITKAWPGARAGRSPLTPPAGEGGAHGPGHHAGPCDELVRAWVDLRMAPQKRSGTLGARQKRSEAREMVATMDELMAERRPSP
jgi:hypothetical protein